MKINITRSETWATDNLDVIERIMNETIEEWVPKDQKIINIEMIERNGMYRFWIYTLEE